MTLNAQLDDTETTRDRLVRVAAELLAEGGRAAVSTRAVSAAAGAQAPTLYRLFGDKAGLLDAVAEYGFEQYLKGKETMAHSEDPIEDLRRGWDLHVEFGLAHPAFYALMYGEHRPGKAAREADAILHRMLARVAAAGRLRMGVERAVHVTRALARGVVMELISMPPDNRDLEISAIARESALQAVTTPGPADLVLGQSKASPAIALRAALEDWPLVPLTEGEQVLLKEWLDQIANAPAENV
jgi:AcrR family transcriptional regulator